jgi:hypothetical protein
MGAVIAPLRTRDGDARNASRALRKSPAQHVPSSSLARRGVSLSLAPHRHQARIPGRMARAIHPADEGTPCAFAALPQGLVHAIFARVPVDTRLRCSEVCPAWRDTLMARSLWTRLDLSVTSGVSHYFVIGDALLRAAAARAGGFLAALDVSVTGPTNDERTIEFDTLCDVLAANVSTLCELHVSWTSCYEVAPDDDGNLEWRPAPNTAAHFAALLEAAPLLQVLHASEAHCTEAAEMRPLLRNEPPFGPCVCGTCSCGLITRATQSWTRRTWPLM